MTKIKFTYAGHATDIKLESQAPYVLLRNRAKAYGLNVRTMFKPEQFMYVVNIYNETHETYYAIDDLEDGAIEHLNAMLTDELLMAIAIGIASKF